MAKQVKWNARKLKREVALTVHQKIEKAAIMIESDIKRSFVTSPSPAGGPPGVDTGRLRTSITHEVERSGKEIIGRVGTNVDYAIPLEYGTSRMAARPFLRVGLNKNIPKIRQLFRRKR